jgi:transposase
MIFIVLSALCFELPTDVVWKDFPRKRGMSKTYPSDLTDEQWAVLEPLILPSYGGHPRVVDLRRVVNAICYRNRSGCQWRMLPTDFPPWGTGYGVAPSRVGSSHATVTRHAVRRLPSSSRNATACSLTASGMLRQAGRLFPTRRQGSVWACCRRTKQLCRLAFPNQKSVVQKLRSATPAACACTKGRTSSSKARSWV